jgi:hypothetical protein
VSLSVPVEILTISARKVLAAAANSSSRHSANPILKGIMFPSDPHGRRVSAPTPSVLQMDAERSVRPAAQSSIKPTAKRSVPPTSDTHTSRKVQKTSHAGAQIRDGSNITPKVAGNQDKNTSANATGPAAATSTSVTDDNGRQLVRFELATKLVDFFYDLNPDAAANSAILLLLDDECNNNVDHYRDLIGDLRADVDVILRQWLEVQRAMVTFEEYKMANRVPVVNEAVRRYIAWNQLRLQYGRWTGTTYQISGKTESGITMLSGLLTLMTMSNNKDLGIFEEGMWAIDKRIEKMIDGASTDETVNGVA